MLVSGLQDSSLSTMASGGDEQLPGIHTRLCECAREMLAKYKRKQKQEPGTKLTIKTGAANKLLRELCEAPKNQRKTRENIAYALKCHAEALQGYEHLMSKEGNTYALVKQTQTLRDGHNHAPASLLRYHELKDKFLDPETPLDDKKRKELFELIKKKDLTLKVLEDMDKDFSTDSGVFESSCLSGTPKDPANIESTGADITSAMKLRDADIHRVHNIQTISGNDGFREETINAIMDTTETSTVKPLPWITENQTALFQENISSCPVSQLRKKSSAAYLSETPGDEALSGITCAKSLSFPDLRANYGGKGAFLTQMQQAGLPVPAFTCIPATIWKAVFTYPLSAQALGTQYPISVYQQLFTPDTGVFTLESLCEQANSHSPDQRARALDSMAGLIKSQAFYNEIKNSAAASHINSMYEMFSTDSVATISGNSVPSGNKLPEVILRSSGQHEDDYGNAQAGRFASIKHTPGNDILCTYLQVMASGFSSSACTTGTPSPMAMVLQHYVRCHFGGVLMSYTALQDNTLQITYTTGQPERAVSGLYAITPHCYQIPRRQASQGSNNVAAAIFKPGSLMEMGQTSQLDDSILSDLTDYTTRLEDMLGCPVDIEFGVDENNRLQLLQVRPVTRLPGEMSFTIPAPDNNDLLTSGTMVSEGCCSGVLAAPRSSYELALLPEGVIIYAEHGCEWMLAPDCLKKAGGFIFNHGSTTDHVAITLRQEEKPCLITEAPLLLREHLDKTVTLVAGYFNAVPGGYLLCDNRTETLMQYRDNLCKTDFSNLAPTETASHSPAINDVAKGFQRLTHQNNRLLDYFHGARPIYRCLSPQQRVVFSMSPNREQTLKCLQQEVTQFLQELQWFVQGYGQFLALAQNTQDDSITEYLDNFSALQKKFATLHDETTQILAIFTRDYSAPRPLNNVQHSFEQWLQSADKLYILLQSLCQPDTPEKITSCHDIIYFVHRQFVNATAAVARLSEQGIVTEEKHDLKYIIFTDNTSAAENILNKSCYDSISDSVKFTKIPTVIVTLPHTVMLTMELGIHMATLQMHKNPDDKSNGGWFIVKLTDVFENNDYNPGKLKRAWFLVQLLRATGVKDFNVHFNSGKGELLLERQNIEALDEMQKVFCKILSILPFIEDTDVLFSDIWTDNNGPVWNISTLDHWLKSDLCPEKAICFKRFLFIALFNQGQRNLAKGLLLKKSLCLPNVVGEYQDFVDTSVTLLTTKSWEEIAEQWQALPSNTEKEKALKEEFRYCLLISGYYILLKNYQLLEDKNLVKQLVSQNRKLFKHLPMSLRADRDVVQVATKSSGFPFEFASDELRKDLDFIKQQHLSGCSTITHYMHPSLKEDKKALLFLISHHALFRVPAKFYQDTDILLSLAKEMPSKFSRIETSLSPDTVIKMLDTNPEVWKFLCKPLKEMPEVHRHANKTGLLKASDC